MQGMQFSKFLQKKLPLCRMDQLSQSFVYKGNKLISAKNFLKNSKIFFFLSLSLSLPPSLSVSKYDLDLNNSIIDI